MTFNHKSADEDRLSNLPEDNVLSLLPLKEAARTSFASKRWRYGWMLVFILYRQFVYIYLAIWRLLKLTKNIISTTSNNECFPGQKEMTSENKSTHEDRLSNLPEDILTSVLSLLPLKEAARTSIVSKRWRYGWMLVSNLEFDNVTPYESVDQVLELRKSKIEILRLHFSELMVPKPTLSKWIDEAIRLNVSELDILVKQVDLPLSLFTCKTLTTFRLKFHPDSDELWECPSLVSLPCLKTLDIVVYSNPLENAFKLIHGCPILENLSLEVTMHFSKERYYFAIPTLKRLTLSILNSPAKSSNKVVLNVPNLEYLSISEPLSCPSFEIKNLSSLIEAKASCSIENGHLWYELLKGISNAKHLSLNINWSSPDINSLSSLPEFLNVKQLELRDFPRRAWWLVSKFLERCSELEHFCLQEPVDCSNENPQPVPILRNLKTIRIISLSGDEHALQFLKFMLARSIVLKSLTVEFNPYVVSPRKEDRLSRYISRLSRASKDCELHFARSKEDDPWTEM